MSWKKVRQKITFSGKFDIPVCKNLSIIVVGGGGGGVGALYDNILSNNTNFFSAGGGGCGQIKRYNIKET